MRLPRTFVLLALHLRVVLLASALLVGLFALAPIPARAIYGPAAGGFGADIVSVDNASDEQGNAGTVDAAISANGRYVVFQTRATNFFEDDGGVVGSHGVEPDAEPPGTLREGGIFRYDRATGAIQLVADGSEVHTEGTEKGKLVFQGAQSPSVSADGRYVVFSTAQQLVPKDTNENVDVYVRDMGVPLTADRKGSGAYTLVSARDGGDQPASYAPRNPPLKAAEPGAEVWPNTSISADGRYVVFRTTELTSNLPDHTTVDTPPRQLFVRDLQAKTTTLLSRATTTVTYPSGDPAGGATGPASISADGTTVAWVATNAPAQTRFLPGESLDPSQPYYLWKRWQESGAPIRRVTGLADPDDPACPPGGEVTQNPQTIGPCFGPLSEQESGLAGIAGVPPALSGDGYTVAFLAGAALRPNITKSNGLDVFLTSMRPGVTRKAGTRELTLGVSSGNPGSTPSIESLALSADGSTIAFTTTRNDFVLPEPQPVGAFRPLPTASDLYVIRVAANTLERVVVNYEGGDPNGSISVDPTLSQDGSIAAFVSSSSNLVFGDANGLPDAFIATLQAPAGTAPPPAGVNSAQGGFSLSGTAAPELGLHVKRAKDGGLIVLVETPGPGRLTAKASATIQVKVGRKARSKRVVLARASGTARSEGTTTLVLRVASKYAKDVGHAGKLKASITVDFTPPAPAEALSSEANATFVSVVAKKAAKSTSKGY
jgi:Tol biopolymer transport system component